jgi:glucose-6-phosphate isomerase, archaeal
MKIKQGGGGSFMNNEIANDSWLQGFTIDFSLVSGLSKTRAPSRRYLADMRGMYIDAVEFNRRVDAENPLVYEFYELGCPKDPGDIAFGTSIVYPGQIGAEYFFTKGHFHTVLDTGEVYYCLSGQGFMLIENPEGDWHALRLTSGQAAYVPKRYAHRSINTGSVPLVTFFAFRGDAGHNYGTIESRGFRKIIVEQGGLPVILDNPCANCGTSPL